MKNIQQFDTFDLSEGYYDKAPNAGREYSPEASTSLWKEKFNPDHQDLYDGMIDSAKTRSGGAPSPEDLLTILSAFELLSETPEEIMAVYKMLKAENPKFNVTEVTMADQKSPAMKALFMIKPYAAELMKNPAYGGSKFDRDKLFNQGKLDF